jgi:glucose-1-phosphate thymidylyltransferase
VKGCIVFAGIGDALQGWPDNRSLALQNLAGSCVLGHVLSQLQDFRFEGLTILADRNEEAIKSWVERNVENSRVQVLADSSWTNPLQALYACRESFEDSPLLLVQGSDITRADYGNIGQGTADVTVLEGAREVEPLPRPGNSDAAVDSWAGVMHFRQGHDLTVNLEHAFASDVADLGSLREQLKRSGLTVGVQPATMCLDTRTVPGLLLANARLLSLGYGSDDAIERSYVEDFTVVPPVFLHETAEIVNSVIGPFANIEAGARIVSSVLSNSLVGTEAIIEGEVLEGALIGERARVKSDGRALLIYSGQWSEPGG